MGRSIRIWEVMITVFVAMMLAQNATGQNLYACLGGCYNVCFLLGSKPLAERYPCYLNCLASCFPQSALEKQLNHCYVGCSAERCLEVKNGTTKQLSLSLSVRLRV
ncbi:hypothetical protein ACH5RR_041077 [Cinchona calisaya]|uniref:Thionin-like protein n=1 Tax=Cinchona calisaya TaxID=153742 RepID=A0ABD2XWI1_9GENT